MVLSRIHGCVYGAADPKGGFLGTLADLSHHPKLNHHFDVVAGVEADACAEQLRSFFREVRKIRRMP
jgi:tRNA(adenine34) deaminase